MFRAVVFDLWQTLATWPDGDSLRFRRRWAESIGVSVERLDELWYSETVYVERESRPIRQALAALYDALGGGGDVEEVLRWRLALTKRALQPGPGVVQTLQELRRRRVPVGLISNCTEDVALVWNETPFAGLFDVAIFSATAGCLKPDRRIYEQALHELRCEAAVTLFVGDGANDELEGARRVGMTPVLFENGTAPLWAGLETWSGLRITAIPQVLELVP